MKIGKMINDYEIERANNRILSRAGIEIQQKETKIVADVAKKVLPLILRYVEPKNVMLTWGIHVNLTGLLPEKLWKEISDYFGEYPRPHVSDTTGSVHYAWSIRDAGYLNIFLGHGACETRKIVENITETREQIRFEAVGDCLGLEA